MCSPLQWVAMCSPLIDPAVLKHAMAQRRLLGNAFMQAPAASVWHCPLTSMWRPGLPGTGAEGPATLLAAMARLPAAWSVGVGTAACVLLCSCSCARSPAFFSRSAVSFSSFAISFSTFAVNLRCRSSARRPRSSVCRDARGDTQDHGQVCSSQATQCPACVALRSIACACMQSGSQDCLYACTGCCCAQARTCRSQADNGVHAVGSGLECERMHCQEEPDCIVMHRKLCLLKPSTRQRTSSMS